MEVLAEPISNVEGGWVLDNKGFNESGEGEERLVREQGRDEANEPHVREARCLMGDGTTWGERVGAAFYASTWQRLPGVESGA